MAPIQLAEWLALLIALALFLGLAFEEVYERDEQTIPGGIRTFPLISLARAMLYLMEPHLLLAFVAGLIAVALCLSLAWADASAKFGSKPGGSYNEPPRLCPGADRTDAAPLGCGRHHGRCRPIAAPIAVVPGAF